MDLDKDRAEGSEGFAKASFCHMFQWLETMGQTRPGSGHSHRPSGHRGRDAQGSEVRMTDTA